MSGVEQNRRLKRSRVELHLRPGGEVHLHAGQFGAQLEKRGRASPPLQAAVAAPAESEQLRMEVLE